MADRETAYCHLKLIDPGTGMTRGWLNQNTEALDLILHELSVGTANIVVGTYMGDGQVQRTIELGFAPRALILNRHNGEMYSSTNVSGGLALQGFPLRRNKYPSVELSETGFRVGANYDESRTSNLLDTLYYFLAVR